MKGAIKIKREIRNKEEASIKVTVFSREVVDSSEGCGSTLLNCQFHDHYVKTELHPNSLMCDLAVNVAPLLPSLQSHCREAPFVLDT